MNKKSMYSVLEIIYLMVYFWICVIQRATRICSVLLRRDRVSNRRCNPVDVTEKEHLCTSDVELTLSFLSILSTEIVHPCYLLCVRRTANLTTTLSLLHFNFPKFVTLFFLKIQLNWSEAELSSIFISPLLWHKIKEVKTVFIFINTYKSSLCLRERWVALLVLCLMFHLIKNSKWNILL